MVVVRSMTVSRLIGRRDLGLQLRQDGAHAVDGVDDIGVRLTPDEEQNRGFAIHQTRIADVFRPRR